MKLSYDGYPWNLSFSDVKKLNLKVNHSVISDILCMFDRYQEHKSAEKPGYILDMYHLLANNILEFTNAKLEINIQVNYLKINFCGTYIGIKYEFELMEEIELKAANRIYFLADFTKVPH
jgi:hypothetical protein